jgi:hypothetical protein
MHINDTRMIIMGGNDDKNKAGGPTGILIIPPDPRDAPGYEQLEEVVDGDTASIPQEDDLNLEGLVVEGGQAPSVVTADASTRELPERYTYALDIVNSLFTTDELATRPALRTQWWNGFSERFKDSPELIGSDGLIRLPVYFLEDTEGTAVAEGIAAMDAVFAYLGAPIGLQPAAIDPEMVDVRGEGPTRNKGYVLHILGGSVSGDGPDQIYEKPTMKRPDSQRRRYGVLLADNHLVHATTSLLHGEAQDYQGVDFVVNVANLVDIGYIPPVTCALVTTNAHLVPTAEDGRFSPKLNRRGVSVPVTGFWKPDLYETTKREGDMAAATVYVLAQIYSGNMRPLNSRHINSGLTMLPYKGGNVHNQSCTPLL